MAYLFILRKNGSSRLLLSLILATSLVFSSELSFHPSLHQDNLGNRISLWMSLDNDIVSIQSSTLPSKGEWSKPITISTSTRSVANPPAISLNGLGQMIVIWASINTPLGINCLEASFYAIESGWTTPFVLSSSNEDVKGGNYHASFDDEGTVVVLWNSQTTSLPLQMQIRTITGSSSGWNSPITLSTTTTSND